MKWKRDVVFSFFFKNSKRFEPIRIKRKTRVFDYDTIQSKVINFFLVCLFINTEPVILLLVLLNGQVSFIYK